MLLSPPSVYATLAEWLTWESRLEQFSINDPNDFLVAASLKEAKQTIAWLQEDENG